ncbi:MAG TPA: hypothetical protein VGL39_27960 [Jatrophihabitantaceae bacterium]|jgi:hypothetical protein
MTAPGDDEFTEIHEADIPRVDLVGKSANGLSFLIAKSEDGPAGMFAPEFVRSLVAKSDSTGPDVAETVTVTGSPGAIAHMIHKAAQRATPEPSDVSKEHTMTAPADVAKADGPDLEVGDIVAEAPTGGTGDSVPGSADWEELDAETAWGAISVLGRAKSAVEWLATRENTEAVNSNDIDSAADSSMAAYDLGEVCYALDYAISCLGSFAAGEKLEAEMAEELQAVGKAFAGLDADLSPLSTIERYAPVVKAGKVLSSANETAIRGAVEQLQKVLASLPAAPDAADGVAKSKETTVTATATAATAETTEVEKAKGDPQVAVYDANGNLVGVADPSSITPLSDAKAPGADAADDLEPAPAAEVGTPADAPEAAPAAPAPVAAAAPAADDEDVTKTEATTTDTDPADLLKSIAADLVKAALDDYSAKQADVVKELEDRVAKMEELPAPPKVGSNGVRPPVAPEHLRGQDTGAATADVTKADDLRERLAKAQDPAERDAISNEMNEMASTALAALHATRR